MRHLKPAVFLIACGALGVAPAAALDPFLFAVTSDYETSGSCAKLELTAPWTAEPFLASVCVDPVVRDFHDGRLYVVNRWLCDNIQVLDAETFETTLEFSVGEGSNPQDIVVIDPNRAYVSRQMSRWLLVVDPSTGEFRDTIDLGVFADADGLPEMAGMIRVGDLLYIQIQRLDQNVWLPVAPSYLAVVDITTNALVDADPGTPGVQGIELTGLNPVGQMSVDSTGTWLYVAEVGEWLVFDGGIERVRVGGTPHATGFITTETQLGGDVGSFALPPAGDGFAAVQLHDWVTWRLVSFSPATGELLRVLHTTGYIADIEIDLPTSQLFIADRQVTAPGVHVFDTQTGDKLTSGPISTGLPPTDLLIVRENPAGGTGDSLPESVLEGLTWAVPNPARAHVRIGIVVPRPGPLQAGIYDVGGCLVRALARDLPAGAGEMIVDWNGRDAQNRPAAPGVYVYRVDGNGFSMSGRIVLTR